MTIRPTLHVYFKQSSHQPLDWRYAHHWRDNVFQIGTVCASNEPDAHNKIYHRATILAYGRPVCLTPLVSDIRKDAANGNG